MKKSILGIGFLVLVIIAGVYYAVSRERKIDRLEGELSTALAEVKTDTVSFDSIHTVVTVDSAKVKQQEDRIIWLRRKLSEKVPDVETLEVTTIFNVLDEALAEPCNKVIEFDSLIVWGMNRITFYSEVDCGKETAKMTFGKYFHPPRQKRFGVGLFIGGGIGYNRKPDILVGIGLTYRIKSIF